MAHDRIWGAVHALLTRRLRDAEHAARTQPEVRQRCRRLLKRIARRLVSMLAVVGAAVLAVTVMPVDDWVATKFAGPWEDPKGDILIVLSGSMERDGVLGHSSYLRCHYAVRAYREGTFRTIVLTGGGPSVPAAVAMKDFLEAYGVPPSAIKVEVSATSTRESALYTKPLLATLPGSKVLMTSDYHMLRAHRAFANVGIAVVPRPLPDARKFGMSWIDRWPVFLELVREAGKIVYYYLNGWL